jgi:hypothetical protein
MPIRERLLVTVDGYRGVAAADRLCAARAVLLDVDAAAISLIFDGAPTGTLGSSSARRPVPGLDQPAGARPRVDLGDPEDRRWPAFGPALLAHHIRGVYAMPVVVAGEYVGALDLFRHEPGLLDGEHLSGAIIAAELASVPLLDLLDADLHAAVADPNSNAWVEFNDLSRAEVSQATGMLVAQPWSDSGPTPTPLGATPPTSQRTSSLAG